MTLSWPPGRSVGLRASANVNLGPTTLLSGVCFEPVASESVSPPVWRRQLTCSGGCLSLHWNDRSRAPVPEPLSVSLMGVSAQDALATLALPAFNACS